MNNLKLNDLKPGDVLLCRGEGWVSDLIALLDGGPYSHTALYVGSNDGKHYVIQATGQGIRRDEITILQQETFTDVFRFNKNNHKLGDEDYPYQPLGSNAEEYASEGIKYAYDHLILLAILAVTRDIPLDYMTKKILRNIIDNAASYLFKLLDKGKTPMVCSELVYRCFSEADDHKKYQLSITGLKLPDYSLDSLEGKTETYKSKELSAEDLELMNAKEAFIELWTKAKGLNGQNPTFIGDPVAACISPKDLFHSKDLEIAGRLNYE
ncbi:hypothetical protein [Alkaliphilus serpentinus]|uniref:Permuted papain-like amidase enzyme, YaeF/YiiX, C92 family n=1 Tax=Alkaliphilus serpentinus TaxID=1482731 RepID=A0A833MAA3_9FIRM|nr:hypothetical protein [Alkaliphilus serpentinus]KAB3530499.1 hypothetical protein F8153_06510 [Alkaliphilus serpentinus]